MGCSEKIDCSASGEAIFPILREKFASSRELSQSAEQIESLRKFKLRFSFSLLERVIEMDH